MNRPSIQERRKSTSAFLYVLLILNTLLIPKLVLIDNRINDGVKCKIYETVNTGITNINVVKKILKTYVEVEFENQDVKPSIFDRAYYPLSKDIKITSTFPICQTNKTD